MPMRTKTHPEGRQFCGVQNRVSRQGGKQEGSLQAGRPKLLFPVGRGSKGTFPGRGKTMTFQGPHGRLVFLQASKLLEETARLEERLRPEKTLGSGQWQL